MHSSTFLVGKKLCSLRKWDSNLVIWLCSIFERTRNSFINVLELCIYSKNLYEINCNTLWCKFKVSTLNYALSGFIDYSSTRLCSVLADVWSWCLYLSLLEWPLEIPSGIFTLSIGFTFHYGSYYKNCWVPYGKSISAELPNWFRKCGRHVVASN